MPDMSLSRRRVLQPGDVLLVCTDGLWSGVRDEDIASTLCTADTPISALLSALCESAVRNGGMASDNTSGAVLRWGGGQPS